MTKQEFLKNLGVEVCSLGVDAFIGSKYSISEYFDKDIYRGANAFLFCCQSEWFVESEWFAKSRLDKFAKEKPGTALLFAARLLSPSQLEYCCNIDPKTALEYADSYLSLDLVELCMKKTNIKLPKYANL